MTKVRTLHDAAMEAVDRVIQARSTGDNAAAQGLLMEAMHHELAAAELAIEKELSAATILVLLRSAANLARDAKQWHEGIDLVIRALSSNDLKSHRTELFHICDTFRTYEHLQLHGVELGETDIQLVVSGPEAAPGFARATEVTRRVEDVHRLLLRSAMHRSGIPFGSNMPRGRQFQETFTPYLSPARAASYAITLRFGVHEQGELKFDNSEQKHPFSVKEALGDLVDAAKAYSEGGPSAVRALIKDEQYAINTASLLRDMSPDTARINTVGLTVSRDGFIDAIALPPRRTFEAPTGEWFAKATGRSALPAATITVVGRLLTGDARAPSKAQAAIVLDNGEALKFRYDEASHGDVIEGYWKHRVRVQLRRVGAKRFMLVDIDDDDSD